MNITFLGTGEACDTLHPNSSILVHAENVCLLLDCGFTAAHCFFDECPKCEMLDSLWISHFHGDHFFGVPLLLLRFYQEGRRKPLTIMSGIRAEEKITALMELAYPGLLNKLPFALEYVKIIPGKKVRNGSVWWSSVNIDHAQPAFGVRIEIGGKSLYYSGDGKPTADSKELMENADLVIHEAFSLVEEQPGHGSVAQCLDLKRELHIPRMALIHLDRELRNQNKLYTYLKKENESGLLLPKDRECVCL